MLSELAIPITIEETSLEVKEQAVPMIIEVPSQEMKEQLDVANKTRQVEGTPENYTTQEKDNIFAWKDIWKKVGMSCDSRKVIDASMQPWTPTGIVASSMSSYSGDSDGPMTVSSGIDTASLSDSSFGSEILETLPSSPYGLGHDLLQTHP